MRGASTSFLFRSLRFLPDEELFDELELLLEEEDELEFGGEGGRSSDSDSAGNEVEIEVPRPESPSKREAGAKRSSSCGHTHGFRSGTGSSGSKRSPHISSMFSMVQNLNLSSNRISRCSGSPLKLPSQDLRLSVFWLRK